MPFRRCSSLKAATGPHELEDSLTFSGSFTAHLNRRKTTAEARRHPPAPSIPPPLMFPALLSLSERSNHIRLSFPTALHPRTNMCRAPFPVFHCRLPFSLLLQADRFAARQIRLRPFRCPASTLCALRFRRCFLPALCCRCSIHRVFRPKVRASQSPPYRPADIPGHAAFFLSHSPSAATFRRSPKKEQLKTKSPLERGLFS